MNEAYTCDLCKVTYLTNWSEEEAEQEFVNSSHYTPNCERAVLCDDCYIEVIEWFEKLTPEERERIEDGRIHQ